LRKVRAQRDWNSKEVTWRKISNPKLKPEISQVGIVPVAAIARAAAIVPVVFVQAAVAIAPAEIAHRVTTAIAIKTKDPS
jgi:hypothetical protein